MTDKEKRELKDGVISIFKRFNILDNTATIGGLRDDILRYINSVQEEPVNIWHDAVEATPSQGSNILMFRKVENDTNYPPIAGCFHGTNSRLDGRNWGYYNGFCYNEIEPPVKWAYIDDILKLSNVQRTVKDWKEPVSEVWYNAKKTLPESSTKQIICIKEDGLSVATVGKIVTGTIKWAYLDTLLHISNKNLTESQCRKLIDTAFELGKAANKDKPVSESIDFEQELYKAFGQVKDFTLGMRIAKHFFELGLKAQHSSINIPNLDDIFEENGIDPNSKDAKIFKECYYMALEKLKAQKGE